MAQEATVVLVDAGPTMRTALRERAALASDLQFKSDAMDKKPQLTTRFDAAIAAVESIMQQKVLVWLALASLVWYHQRWVSIDLATSCFSNPKTKWASCSSALKVQRQQNVVVDTGTND
jgi:hypothetical protein